MSDRDVLSKCKDGPWAAIRHDRDDHDARVVTSLYDPGKGLPKSRSFLGVYEWDGDGWKFKEGMPVVGK
jgi:hypothetical protein